jgi:hypothetical protein
VTMEVFKVVETIAQERIQITHVLEEMPLILVFALVIEPTLFLQEPLVCARQD